MKYLGRKKNANYKNNAAYQNLVKKEKKTKEKKTKLFNLKNNLCRIVTRLKYYTAVFES